MNDRKPPRSLLETLGDLAWGFGEERVLDAAGQVLKTVARTKARVDDNVAALLGLANLPSRAEIDKLRRDLEVVQAAVAGLSRKVNRLLEETSGRATVRPRRATRPKTKAGPRAAAAREENLDWD